MSNPQQTHAIDATELTFSEERPETLVTEEDYESAPLGTIVSTPDWGESYFKENKTTWRVSAVHAVQDNSEMARQPRTVLRWGWT